MAAAITFLQAADSTADAQTYTFATQNLGTAAADRIIAVCAHCRDTGVGAKSLSSVKIHVPDVATDPTGTTLTINKQVQAAAAASDVTGIASALIASGTSGDVVVTWSESVLRCGIALYKLTGANGTPTDTDSAAGSSPSSAAIDVPANGSALAATTIGGSGTTVTGLTERSEVLSAEGIRYVSASDNFATTQTGLTVTFTASGGSTEVASVFVAWGPVAATGNPYYAYRQQ